VPLHWKTYELTRDNNTQLKHQITELKGQITLLRDEIQASRVESAPIAQRLPPSQSLAEICHFLLCLEKDEELTSGTESPELLVAPSLPGNSMRGRDS
jgi:hypothetical protein